MLADVAQTYSAVFAPELFVLGCTVALVGYEWRGLPDASIPHLGARIGVIGLAWAVAYAIYQGIPVFAGWLLLWGTDATGSVGLAAGMGLLWLGWDRQEWGHLVPSFTALLVVVTVPHLVVTPVWDVSSHVLYAVVPAGYLVALDSRFTPLAVLAGGMVIARPLAGAHTWPQSIGGLVLGVVAVLAAHWWDTRTGRPVGFARS
ncbi:MAG: hypothetical protein ABEI98_11125 [Halorhabdus sp.]